MKLFKAVNSYSKIQIESEVEIIRKGILIVDDSKFSRNILKDILKTEGYSIVGEAGDGLEAVNMAREKKPEYIFMDVEMPKLDGLGAIPKILEIDPKIKIVMCTALGQKNIILEAAKAGAKDYILKPYIKDNIIAVLNEISDKNQKEGQVIPFKAGKNHHDSIDYQSIEDTESPQPIEDTETPQPITDTESPQPVAYIESPQSISDTELLQPLQYDEDSEVDEDLDSLIDQGSMQDSAPEEVLESYLNVELKEEIQTEGEAEPEEAAVIEAESEDVETTAEGETEPEEIAAIEDISEDTETEERAKFVISVLNEDNSQNEVAKEEVEPVEAAVNEEPLVSANSIEETNQDIKSDSNSYTYLWSNRFDSLQKELILHNSLSQWASFYEYTYLETGKPDAFRKDNSKSVIALGMMMVYMSLDNRLQLNDTATFELRTLSYDNEKRFFTSNVLEESNDKFNEITIMNEIKYNSYKPKQKSQELAVKTGFYQFVSDFVSGKSGRILR